MAKAITNTTQEAAIRALVDATARACRAKDVTTLTANYARDVLAFDGVNPLQYAGSVATRKRTSKWFPSWQGPIDFEIHDLNIAADDDIAYCHSLNHVNGTKTDGQNIDMWWRATIGCRKLDGNWAVAHVPNSAPFDVETGKASPDLKP